MRCAVIAALALLSACKPVDRGACLRSHRVPGWTSVTFMPVGDVQVPIFEDHPPHDACDQWQYPQGRPA